MTDWQIGTKLHYIFAALRNSKLAWKNTWPFFSTAGKPRVCCL